MQNTLELNDVLNDDSKNLDNILLFDNNDDDDDQPISPPVCHYLTETEYANTLTISKLSDSCHLKIVSLNIANLLSKLNYFKIFIGNLCNNLNKPNIIAVTETHLNDRQNHGYTKDELHHLIPGYKFFYRNRSNRRGGGVGIFVDDNLAGNLKVEAEDLFVNEVFETLTIRIPSIHLDHGKKDLVLQVIYRQPGNANTDAFLQSLQNWLNLYDKNSNEIIITGDMNLDLLKYQSHTPTSTYLDMLMSHYLTPIITRPTRIKHASATLIDHIFSKLTIIKAGILTSEIAGSHGFTDHYPVFCIIRVHNNLNKPLFKYTKSYFTPVGNEKRREKLNQVDWDNFYSEKDPNRAYQYFQETYSTIYHEWLTTKSYEVKWKNRLREPWMSYTLLQKMKKRDRLSKLSGRRADFKRLRNEITKDCRKAEREYYKKKIADSWNNIKEQWNVLRQVMGKTNNKSEFPAAFQHEGKWLLDKNQIANGINEYYSKVGPDTNKSVGKSSKDAMHYLKKNREKVTHQMLESNFTEEDVYNACQLLYPKSSCDAYGLSQKVILQDMDIIAPMFVKLINLSVSSGTCPDMSKVAKVIPVYKNKGENYLFSNYRPISMLPVFSKIVEKLIYSKISDFLVRYEILFKSQYGFRKGHNTTHATLDFLQTIESALKANEYAIGIFCDLSKAFDTLDHEILLTKLDHYGVRGTWLAWLRSYLTNRHQYVEMNGVKSDLAPITVGVPQGSILGPLLFLIYINDLPAAVNKLIPVLFADDTNLVIKGKNLSELITTINEELENLSDYFKANKLKLNAGKTKLVCFRKKGLKLDSSNLNIKLDETNLPFQKSATFLGITLDEHLTWEDHCNLVGNKMSRNTGVLNRVKKALPASS